MKLLTYNIANNSTDQIGILQGDLIFNLNTIFGNIRLTDLIQIDNYQNKILSALKESNILKHNINKIKLLPPIPKPNSFRDAYAFREHVETCRYKRGANK